MRYIYVAVFVFLLLTGVVNAQSSDTFPISQQIIGDIVPPTTPDPLTAVPVASTQIDLSWGASTDISAPLSESDGTTTDVSGVVVATIFDDEE